MKTSIIKLIKNILQNHNKKGKKCNCKKEKHNSNKIQIPFAIFKSPKFQQKRWKDKKILDYFKKFNNY